MTPENFPGSTASNPPASGSRSNSRLDTLHAHARSIFTHALENCSIEAAFDRHLTFEGNDTLVRHSRAGAAESAGEPYKLPLKQYKRIFVVAIGKAALTMLDTLLSRMPRRKGLRGICCAPSIPKKRNWRIRYFAGGHPLPNQGSFDAARAALSLLRRAKKDTFIFFLISGGGSAMFELPLDPHITLEDTTAFHEALVSSGATIAEINTVRKHFSAVKGGRLGIAAPEATKFSLLLPDVPLRHLDALASSPTLPDRTTVEQTREILARYNLLAKFPQAVRHFFERADLPETPGNKEVQPLPTPPIRPSAPEELEQGYQVHGAVRVSNETAGLTGQLDTLLSSNDLLKCARQHAESLGYRVFIDNTCDDWNYADAAKYLLERFHALRKEHPRLCLLTAGEVTIKIEGQAGIGGRNQHFALTCALDLAEYEGQSLVVFSAGSDGFDGNSKSAGAIADSTTVSRAKAYGFDVADVLAHFNSCPLFTALGDSVMTGPTGHNLRDLRILLADSTVK